MLFSHLGKVRANARTLPNGPDPHSYISIERKFCLVANQIGIAIVDWENEIAIAVCVGL